MDTNVTCLLLTNVCNDSQKGLGICPQPKFNVARDINTTGLSLCDTLETTSFSSFVFIRFPAETEETDFFPQAEEQQMV